MAKQRQARVDPSRLAALARTLLSTKTLHVMDERQIWLVRLFFLDRWLATFDVEMPEPVAV